MLFQFCSELWFFGGVEHNDTFTCILVYAANAPIPKGSLFGQDIRSTWTITDVSNCFQRYYFLSLQCVLFDYAKILKPVVTVLGPSRVK